MSTNDPIFAAIERQREAEAAFVGVHDNDELNACGDRALKRSPQGLACRRP